MSSNKTIKWIEAGKLFSKSSNCEILCPECGQHNLKSEDVIDNENIKEFHRIIYCPECGTRNTLRLRRYDI